LCVFTAVVLDIPSVLVRYTMTKCSFVKYIRPYIYKEKVSIKLSSRNVVCLELFRHKHFASVVEGMAISLCEFCVK